jgi:predicted RNA-binding Zn-ribbon protein involved in translation (DUF1610 family)
MRKLRREFQRSMIGRYGSDTLNTVLIYTLFVVLIMNVFLRSDILNWIYAIGLILYFFRFFSKNRVKRKRENQQFVKMIKPLRSRFQLWQHQRADRHHKYYLCPQCNTKVRIPSGRGKVAITCPSCRHEFIKRS